MDTETSIRINRSVKEVFNKISKKTILETARLLRDVKSPLKELQIFLGLKTLDPQKPLVLRSGYKIPFETVHDFQQAFWDCFIRKTYTVYPTDRVIVDVGANIGCFSIYALSKSKDAKVFAFEPSSSNFKRLSRLVAINKAEDKIKTFPMGVAKNSGELSLNVSVDSAFHTSFGHAAQGMVNEKIRVLSLADLLDTLGNVGQIDLMKLDCEGAEMDCLLGANAKTLSRINRLEVEYHEWAGFSFMALTDHLKTCGFELKTLMANSKDQTGNASFVQISSRKD